MGQQHSRYTISRENVANMSKIFSLLVRRVSGILFQVLVGQQNKKIRSLNWLCTHLQYVQAAFNFDRQNAHFIYTPDCATCAQNCTSMSTSPKQQIKIHRNLSVDPLVQKQPSAFRQWKLGPALNFMLQIKHRTYAHLLSGICDMAKNDLLLVAVDERIELYGHLAAQRLSVVGWGTVGVDHVGICKVSRN